MLRVTPSTSPALLPAVFSPGKESIGNLDLPGLLGLPGVGGKVVQSVERIKRFAEEQVDALLNGAVSAAKATAGFAEETLQSGARIAREEIEKASEFAEETLGEIGSIPKKAMRALDHAKQIQEASLKRGENLRNQAEKLREGGVAVVSHAQQEFLLELEEEAEGAETFAGRVEQESQEQFRALSQEAESRLEILTGNVLEARQEGERIQRGLGEKLASMQGWASRQAKRAERFRSDKMREAKEVDSFEDAKRFASNSVAEAGRLATGIREEIEATPRLVEGFARRRVQEAIHSKTGLWKEAQTARTWTEENRGLKAPWKLAMSDHRQRAQTFMSEQAARLTMRSEPVPGFNEELSRDTDRLQASIEETTLELSAQAQPPMELPNAGPSPVLEEPGVPSERKAARSVFGAAPTIPYLPSLPNAAAILPSKSDELRAEAPEMEMRMAKSRVSVPPTPQRKTAPKKPASTSLLIKNRVAEEAPPGKPKEPGKGPIEPSPDFAAVHLPSKSGKKKKAKGADATPAAMQSQAPKVDAPAALKDWQPPIKTPPPMADARMPDNATTPKSEMPASKIGSEAKSPVALEAKTSMPQMETAKPRQPEDPQGFHSKLLDAEGPGSTPDAGTRSALSRHVGFDPAHARFHTGPAAQKAALSLGAEAFTIGRDVFFGAGKYDPKTPKGMGLIGHEVTHVGQQLGLRGDKLRFHTKTGGDAMEQEAQEVGERIATNLRAGPGMRVGRYVRTYVPADDEPVTANVQMRLDRIGNRALLRAGEMLSTSRRGQALRLDEVEVSVELDLETLSEEEAVGIWAEAIVAAVELAQAHGQIGASEMLAMQSTGKAIQRDTLKPMPTVPDVATQKLPGAPPPIPADKAEGEIKKKMDALGASPEQKKMIRQLYFRKRLNKIITTAKQKRAGVIDDYNKSAKSWEAIIPWEFDEKDQPLVDKMLKEYEIGSIQEFEFMEQQFIEMFWNKGIDATKHLLDENEKIALRERDRYWAYDYVPNAVSDLKKAAYEVGTEAYSFTSRYNDIARQENLYHRNHKWHVQIPIVKHDQMHLMGNLWRPDYVPQGYLDELVPRWKAWMKLRKEMGEKFPILLSNFGYGEIFGSTDDKKLGYLIGSHVQSVLNDIDDVRKGLDEDRFWKLPRMIELTRDTLGFEARDGAGIILYEYIKKRQEDEAFWEMLKAAAAIALAITAMVATGGLAAVAMVGSAAMSIHSAVKASYEYTFNAAAVNTALDQAKVVSKEEPSLFALAFEIVAAGLDVGGALHAFNAIKGAVKAVNMVDPETLARLKGAAEAAYDTAVADARTLKLTKSEFVDRIMKLGAKGLAEAEHSASQMRLMAELTQGTSERFRLLLKNDPKAVQKLIDDFGDVGGMVDVLLECGEDGKKILTNVGNHIAAQKQAASAGTKAADAVATVDKAASKAGVAVDDASKAGKAADAGAGVKRSAGAHVPSGMPRTWTPQALDTLLEGTEEGRRAAKVVRDHNIQVISQNTKRGEVFFEPPDKIYIWHEMRPQDAMYYYIHEAGHAEYFATHRTADVLSHSRDEYVRRMIAEEADVQARAIRSKMEMAGEWNIGGQRPFNAQTALEQDYMDAVEIYYQEYKFKAGNNFNGEIANAYAHDNAQKHVKDLFERGEIKASVGDVTYTKYYGEEWDVANLGATRQVTANTSPAAISRGPVKPGYKLPKSETTIEKAAVPHLNFVRKELRTGGQVIPKGSLDNVPHMSSSGFAGSAGPGVRPVRLPDGKGGHHDVVVKLYYEKHAPILESEMAAMHAAEQTGVGPKVYGLVRYEQADGTKLIGIKMDRVPGGFADMADNAAHEAEMLANARNINFQTFQDLNAFRDKMLAQGYYYTGELQGFVDSAGRWRPLDFQGARPIRGFDFRHRMYRTPPMDDPLDQVIKKHNQIFKDMAAELRANRARALGRTP